MTSSDFRTFAEMTKKKQVESASPFVDFDEFEAEVVIIDNHRTSTDERI